MTEHIVALFESDAAAAAATADLERAGVASSAIRRYNPETSDYKAAQHTGGFWAWLLGEEDAIDVHRSKYPRDHEAFDRASGVGNAVLSVTLGDSTEAEQAVTILHGHHPLQIENDLDQSTGKQSSASVVTNAPRGAPATGAEEVIPLAEEEVQVGTRRVDRGTTRVRRYVVETPVQRDVTLHGERVTIERRTPVQGAIPAGAFEERTIEVHETEEVPVVEKTARVVEEVAIRKEATERTETVRDTARREQVEVEGQPKQS